MRAKRFNQWNEQKKSIDSRATHPHFSVGEIWWTQLGQNICTEVVGKGRDFLRPVLILRRVYGNAILAIPLATQKRKGNYYFNFKDSKNTEQCALLTQIRYLDGKRLKYQKSRIKESDFSQLIEQFIRLIKNNPT